jgi:hypothetical protein
LCSSRSDPSLASFSLRLRFLFLFFYSHILLLSDLVSEYQQYQDATAEEDDMADEEAPEAEA